MLAKPYRVRIGWREELKATVQLLVILAVVSVGLWALYILALGPPWPDFGKDARPVEVPLDFGPL